MRAAFAEASPDRTVLFIGAIRCWSRARLRKRQTQPQLAELFSGCGCQILAPVLDALFRTIEASIGRSLIVGNGAALSTDERKIARVLVDPKASGDCGFGRSQDINLRVAIRSARVMLAMSIADLPLGAYPS